MLSSNITFSGDRGARGPASNASTSFQCRDRYDGSADDHDSTRSVDDWRRPAAVACRSHAGSVRNQARPWRPLAMVVGCTLRGVDRPRGRLAAATVTARQAVDRLAANAPATSRLDRTARVGRRRTINAAPHSDHHRARQRRSVAPGWCPCRGEASTSGCEQPDRNFRIRRRPGAHARSQKRGCATSQSPSCSRCRKHLARTIARCTRCHHTGAGSGRGRQQRSRPGARWSGACGIRRRTDR